MSYGFYCRASASTSAAKFSGVLIPANTSWIPALSNLGRYASIISVNLVFLHRSTSIHQANCINK
jgi:hypothetical protein